jgi:hypothetical protein
MDGTSRQMISKAARARSIPQRIAGLLYYGAPVIDFIRQI